MIFPRLRTLILLSLCAAAPLFFLAANSITESSLKSVALDDSWRLWVDDKADWKNEQIYLPREAVLEKLPVNPPTGGWQALSGTAGLAVTLPTSVEEHFWGKFRGDLNNGIYEGVSWWWRSFTAPKLQPGQRLVVRFRAAKLRAEVYCNQKLCGYNLIAETPFAADATDFVHPGEANQLAVRITNPGGDLSWIDWGDVNWGKAKLPRSKGIGGMDAGNCLEVQDPVCIDEIAVLNRPNPREVSIVSTVKNSTGKAYSGPLKLSITNGSKTVWEGFQPISVAAGASVDISRKVEVPSAKLWDLADPILYTATAEIPESKASSRKVNFGFRWFAPEGIGSNALLRLNGKRIVLRSAISWGWWAPNGLFPSDAIAKKEVLAAKALGLNCLQLHRNIGHPNVLDTQDQLGLLRYEEAGNGRTAVAMGEATNDPITAPSEKDKTGQGGEPVTFQQKYEVEKILRMVRRDRSHPSLVLYCIQNEISPALNNPHIFWLFERIREIDPSRTVYLHSGVPFANQVAMLPYTPAGTFCTEDGTGYSGWRDQHTVGGPGNYRDNLYVDKDHYSHRIDNRKEIILWGEMLGVGMPDDHDRIVQWYKTNPENIRTGYDLQVHQAALDAYNAFLDKWSFRSAFPKASNLFQSIGTKSYFFWQKVMETARMCDDNDALVISGWESTHIENHSGLVDQHRNLRADPNILKKSMEPVVLVIRPKRAVLLPGETVDADVHLINETNLHGNQSLTITAHNPDGSVLFEEKRPVKVAGGDVYGQLLSEGFKFAAKATGTVKITGVLQPEEGKGAKLTNTVEVLVVDPLAGGAIMPRVMVGEGTDREISKALSNVFKINPLDLSHLKEPVDAIVLATGSPWRHRGGGVSGAIAKTSEPDLYKNQMHGGVGTIGSWSGFAPGPVKVELHLIEGSFDQAGKRVFDIAVNGASLFTNIDIFQESGGKNSALVKTGTATTADGVVTVSIPKAEKNEALIAALKLTDSNNKVVTVAFSDNACKDHSGQVWQPLDTMTSMVSDAQWQTILKRVNADGARLVIWPNKVAELMPYVHRLAAANILRVLSFKDDRGLSEGYLKKGRDSWMGSWYFARKHWLFDGLPVDSVLGWQYQVSQSADGAGALLIDAVPEHPMEVMLGYGRDHEACVGIGACVIQYGKGTIVIPSLPGVLSSLSSATSDISQPVALRLLGNSLRKTVPSAGVPLGIRN